jgi:hypothetical protein
MPKVRIFLEALAISLAVSPLGWPFLFGGVPGSDWCIVSNSEGTCLGILFFVPNRWRPLAALAAAVLTFINLYPERKQAWLKKQTKPTETTTPPPS